MGYDMVYRSSRYMYYVLLTIQGTLYLGKPPQVGGIVENEIERGTKREMEGEGKIPSPFSTQSSCEVHGGTP